MLNLRLYILQRISALVMIPLVLGHLILMIYAIQDGLSVGEILGRTQGSLFWFLFYGVFVLAVSIHGAIGLRVVVSETFTLSSKALSFFTWASCLFLVAAGGRAVWAVTFGVV